jgi:MFS family permease
MYYDGAIGGLYTVLVGGTVLTGVILWAGGGGFELGLLSALTTAGGLVVLVLRQLERRFGSAKRLTQLSWTGARIAWLPLAIILLVLAFAPPNQRSSVALATLIVSFVAAALAAIGNVTWYGWIARLVPSAQRGEFIAQRTRWLSVAALIALPIVGLVLDQAKSRQQDALGFALVLAGTVPCAVLGWRFLGSIPAKIALPETRTTGGERRKGEISAHRFALYTALFQIGVYFSAPFFQAYSLDRLHLSFGLLMNLQVLSQIVPIVTVGWWGKVVDRVGLRLPLGLCSLGKLVVPLCYVVATPDNWWPVILVYVLSVLDAGIGIANGSAFATIAASPHGSARVAHLNLLISITASATPILAGVLVAQRQIGGIDVLVALFVVSAVGRGLSGLALLLPEGRPKRRRVRGTVVPAPEVG